ncbi:MAG: D-2-hydroxyacid dehydrogenase [Ruminococcus sp.]|nr:D-2-hydroxyacid dehydrogenase [Ruminococcus sp.]
MKIAVLDWDTMTCAGDISPAPLEELGETAVYGLTAPELAAERIGSAEAVLCNKVPITAEVIEKCPNLRYIGLFATGYNNIDIPAATKAGITVCNAGEYSTAAVAQQVFAYILDWASRVRDYDSDVKAGQWEASPTFSYFPIPTCELAGKTLSVVGFGSIGRTVAAIGAAFGMKVLVNTRTQPDNCPYELCSLEEAAARADVLTFHCPLTEKTAGMVNAGLLGKMKPSAILINTSRGGVVCEEELAQALDCGQIAGAYLDVLSKEPMSPDCPLKSAKNCTITPHVAWAPLETRERLLSIVCENLRAWQKGSPINKVN